VRFLGCFVLIAFTAGFDDSGDLRPEARALLEAVEQAEASPSLAEARGQSSAKPELELTPPATIRVWRRRVDGSTASCAGRVDVLPFEDYVKGVLPNEWISSWDERSLEMGGLCARSYAWFLVRAGGKYECADVDDTAASQVYTDARPAKTSAAVERTRGMAIVRDGSIVLAEYSAENGSPTRFGVDEPYCAGKTVNGHGRGTCQWGTQRWAVNEGKDYRWMAAHYYPGATVWAPPPPRPALDAMVVDVLAPAELVVGRVAAIAIEVENAGAAAWDARVRLGTRAPSPLATPAWLDASRAVALGEVAPGGRARVQVEVAAVEAGDHRLALELVRDDGETATWFGGEPIELALRAVAAGAEPGVDGGDLTGGCRVGGAGGAPALVLALVMVLRPPRTGRRTPRA
jgi:hypothetical protein